jgi:putative ABC transport system substrate-binding protein
MQLNETGRRLNRRQVLERLGPAVGLVLLAGCDLVTPLMLRAQRVMRVGYLAGGSPTVASNYAAFRDVLREHCWIEGQNVVYEFRDNEGQIERTPSLATELVGSTPDVLVGGGPSPTIALQDATRTIPIVMINVGDPVGYGLVASLARPGGNITGVSIGTGLGLPGKRLELLKEMLPGLTRVLHFTNTSVPGAQDEFEAISTTGSSLGIQVRLAEVRSGEDVERAFAAAREWPADALHVTNNQPLAALAQRVADLAAQSRLPAMYGARVFTDRGG